MRRLNPAVQGGGGRDPPTARAAESTPTESDPTGVLCRSWWTAPPRAHEHSRDACRGALKGTRGEATSCSCAVTTRNTHTPSGRSTNRVAGTGRAPRPKRWCQHVRWEAVLGSDGPRGGQDFPCVHPPHHTL